MNKQALHEGLDRIVRAQENMVMATLLRNIGASDDEDLIPATIQRYEDSIQNLRNLIDEVQDE